MCRQWQFHATFQGSHQPQNLYSFLGNSGFHRDSSQTVVDTLILELNARTQGGTCHVISLQEVESCKRPMCPEMVNGNLTERHCIYFKHVYKSLKLAQFLGLKGHTQMFKNI